MLDITEAMHIGWMHRSIGLAVAKGCGENTGEGEEKGYVK